VEENGATRKVEGLVAGVGQSLDGPRRASRPQEVLKVKHVVEPASHVVSRKPSLSAMPGGRHSSQGDYSRKRGEFNYEAHDSQDFLKW
jgi:hypothetical protein